MSENVLTVVGEAVNLLKRRKDLFLGTEEVFPQDLVTAVALDALLLGANRVEILHAEEWWLVFAQDDWLQVKTEQNLMDVFRGIHPLPNYKQNQCRHEVFLTAYAAHVFTSFMDEESGTATLTVIKGDKAEIGNIFATAAIGKFVGRVVGFKL